MRYFLLIGIRHGESEPVLIGFPPATEAERQFKDLIRSGQSEEFRQVALLSSTAGILRERKLKPVPPAPSDSEQPPVPPAPAVSKPTPVSDEPPAQPPTAKRKK